MGCWIRIEATPFPLIQQWQGEREYMYIYSLHKSIERPRTWPTILIRLSKVCRQKRSAVQSTHPLSLTLYSTSAAPRMRGELYCVGYWSASILLNYIYFVCRRRRESRRGGYAISNISFCALAQTDVFYKIKAQTEILKKGFSFFL